MDLFQATNDSLLLFVTAVESPTKKLAIVCDSCESVTKNQQSSIPGGCSMDLFQATNDSLLLFVTAVESPTKNQHLQYLVAVAWISSTPLMTACYCL